jgi:antitoxin MazE
MISKVLKSGDDAYQLLIPKAVAEKLGFSSQTSVELRIEGNRLVVIPKRSSLEELLEKITPETLHSEVDWGRSEGKEEW